MAIVDIANIVRDAKAGKLDSSNGDGIKPKKEKSLTGIGKIVAGVKANVTTGRLPFFGSLSPRNPKDFNFDIYPTQDAEFIRARNQSAWDQFGNWAAQSVFGEIIGGGIQAIGATVGLFDQIINRNEADFNNFITDFGNSITEKTREAFPIFRTDPNATFDVKDFGWWMSNAVSIASTISLLIPATGVVKGLSFLARMTKLANLGRGTKQGLKLAVGAGVMRNAENFRESMEVVKVTKDEADRAFQDEATWESFTKSEVAKEMEASGFPVTKEQAAIYIASKAGWRAYAVNASNVVFDALQLSVIYRPFATGTRNLIRPSRSVQAANVGKTLTTGQKTAAALSINPLVSVFGRQLTEGVEEGINFIGAREGEFYGKSLLGERGKDLDARFDEYLSDGRLWEAAFWGVLGGIAFEGGARGIARLGGANRGAQSTRGKIAEIEGRKRIIGDAASTLKAIENKEGIFGELTDDERTAQIINVKSKLIFDLGIRASQAGNVDLLLEQIETKEFQDALIEAGIATQESIQQDTQAIRQGVEEAETVYKNQTKRFANKSIKDRARNFIVSRAIGIDKVRTLNDKQRSLFELQVTEQKGKSKSYKRLSKNRSNIDDAIRLRALQRAKQILIEQQALALDAAESTEADLQRFVEVNKELDKQIKEVEKNIAGITDNKVTNADVTSEIRDIIEIEAGIELVDAADPVLEKELENLDSKEGIEKSQEELDNLQKRRTKEYKQALNAAVKVASFKEGDTLDSIQSKITTLTQLRKEQPNDLTEVGNPIIDKAIAVLQVKAKSIKTKGEVQDNKDKPEDEQDKDVEDANTEDEAPTDESSNEEEHHEDTTETSESVVTEYVPVEGSTAIALVFDDGSPVGSNFSGDKGHVISRNGGLYQILTGQVKKGTPIEFLADVDNRKGIKKGVSITEENFAIRVELEDGTLIGFINTIEAKEKFLKTIKEESEFMKEQGATDKEIDTRLLNAEKELESLKKFRKQLFEFNNVKIKQGEPSAQIASTVENMDAFGSIINTTTENKLSEVFEGALVFYKTGADTVTLIPPNSSEEAFFRQANAQSIRNNFDSVYTPGAWYVLVKTPSGELLPIKLRRSNLNLNYANKLRDSMMLLIEELDSGAKLKSNRIRQIKDFMNEMSYVANTGTGNGIRVVSNKISIPYEEDGKRRIAVVSFGRDFQAPAQPAIPILSIHERTNDGKAGQILEDASKGIEAVRNKLPSVLTGLTHNPNVKNLSNKQPLINSNEGYVSPLSRDPDGTPRSGAKEHTTYNDYLNDEKILTANVGTVRDEEGNIVSNFAGKDSTKSNLVISVNFGGLIAEEKTPVKPEEEDPAKEVAQSIRDARLKAKGSLTKFMVDMGLKDSKWFNLIKFVEDLGVELTVSNGLSSAIGIYNSKSNKISINSAYFAMMERSGTRRGSLIIKLDEVLAHEAIHGLIHNRVKDQTAFDNDIVEFIAELKPHLATAPTQIRITIEKILNGIEHPEEIITYTFTNTEFAAWLNSIPAKKSKRSKAKTLGQRLKEIILKIVRDMTGVATKIDELAAVLDLHITDHDNIKPKTEEGKKEDGGLEGDIFNMSIGAIKQSLRPIMERKDIDESVASITSFLLLVRARNPGLDTGQYRNMVVGFLENQLNKGLDNATNISKALANFDSIFTLVLDKLRQEHTIENVTDATEEQFTELRKSFEDEGVLTNNSKDRVPIAVKNLIRTTIEIVSINTKETVESGNRYERKRDDYLGIGSFIEFNRVYPYIERNMVGALNPQEMLDRLGWMSKHDLSLAVIKEKLQADPALLSAWYSHFNMQSLNMDRDEIAIQDGKVVAHSSLLSNRNNAHLVLRDKWINQITTMLDSGVFDDKFKEKMTTLSRELGVALNNFDKGKTKAVNNIVKAYNAIGIELIEDGKDVLKKAIVNEMNNSINIAKFGTAKKVLIAKFVNPLKFIVSNISKGTFNNVGDLRSVAESVQLYKYDLIQNNTLNVEGKSIHTITLPNFISNFFNLVSNPSPKGKLELQRLLDKYLSTPELSKSNWVLEMVKREKGEVVKDEHNLPILNEDFIDKFTYILLDGFKSDAARTGKKYTSLSDRDWDLLNVLKYAKDFNAGIFKAPMPIPADGGMMFYIQSKVYGGDPSDINSPIFKAIENTVLAEINGMRAARDLMFTRDEDGNLVINENLDTSKLQRHYHYSMDNQGRKTYLKNGIPVGRVFQFQNIPEMNGTSMVTDGVLADELGKEHLGEMRTVISEFIQSEIALGLEEFQGVQDMLPDIIEDTGLEWNKFVESFVLNQYIANAEMFALFNGRISEFKNRTDSNKRAKHAPGLSLSMLFSGSTFTSATLTSVVLRSQNINDIIGSLRTVLEGRFKGSDKQFDIENILNKSPSSALEKEVFKIAENYLAIDTTDAQGYLTLDRYENVLKDLGRWSDQFEVLFPKLRSGATLSQADLALVLQPLKPKYDGKDFDSDTGRFMQRQIKYSAIPLIPQLTKGTQLDVIRKWAEDKNIDEIIYDSAFKVGAKDITTVHDEDGNLVPSSLDNVKVDVLNNKNWLIQLDVPDHVEDTQNRLGTQISKLIIANISNDTIYKIGSESINGGKLKRDYLDILVANIEESAQDLLKEMGAIINDSGTVSVPSKEKVQAVLERELGRREAAEVFLEAIEFLPSKNEFSLPLFITNMARRYESVLLSMFTNNVTRQKLSGGSFVQFSNMFLDGGRNKKPIKESQLDNTGIKYIDSKKEDRKLKYSILNTKGTTVIKTEVLLPAWSSAFFEEGQLIDINKLPENVRTMIGYRIPTDAKHTMIHLEVVGFLPREMGATMVLPDEVVTQMGSDFDVDKLFLIRPHFLVNDKETDDGITEEIEFDGTVVVRPTKDIKTVRSITKLEYNTGSKIRSNSKKQRDNRIFDFYLSILSNPVHYAELMSPAEFTNVIKIADKVNSLKGLGEEDINVLSYFGQKKLRTRNIVARALKGISANFNSFGSIAQVTGMELRADIAPIFKFTKSERNVAELKRRYKGDIVAEDKTTITIRFRNLGTARDGSYLNINGDLILEHSAEGLTSTVDATKTPTHDRFNSNTYTYNTLNTMVLAGLDWNHAGLFIAQPVLEEVSKEFFSDRGVAGTNSNQERNTIRRKFQEQLLILRGTTYKDYRRLITDKNKDTRQASREEAAELIGYRQGELIAFSETELEGGIRNETKGLSGKEQEGYLIRQLQVLDAFDVYVKAGQGLRDIILATKVDGLGAGPTSSITHELEAGMLRSRDYINDRVDPFGESMSKPRVLIDGDAAIDSIYPQALGLDKESLYSPLEAYYKFSNDLSRKFISNFFIHETPVFNELVVNILNSIGRGYTADNAGVINRYFTSKLLHDLDFFRLTDTDVLFGLREGEESVAQLLFKVQNNPKYKKELLGTTRHLLDMLDPQLSDRKVELNGGLHLIDFRNVNDANLDNHYSDSFLDMWNSEDEVLKDLAEKLLKYSFFQNGFQFGLRSFSKIIPVEVLQSIRVTSHLNDLKAKADVGDALFDASSVDIFFRTNWNNNEFVPAVRIGSNRFFDKSLNVFVEKQDLTKGVSFPDKNGFIKMINNPDNAKGISKRVIESQYIRLPRWRKATKKERADNPENGFVLVSNNIYVKVFDDGQHFWYLPVPKLGVPGKFVEFSFESVIKENNPYTELPYDSFDQGLLILQSQLGDATPVKDLVRTEVEDDNGQEEDGDREDTVANEELENRKGIISAFKNLGFKNKAKAKAVLDAAIRKPSNFDIGTRVAMTEGRSEEDYNRQVLDESNNPFEIATIYLTAKGRALSENEARDADKIFDFFASGGKVSIAGFDFFGDKNVKSDVRTLIKKDGKKIDNLAQDLGIADDNTDVIIDWMRTYGSVANYRNIIVNAETEFVKDLSDKFEKIVGVPLNVELADAISRGTEQSRIEGEQLEDITITVKKVQILSDAFRNAGVEVTVVVDYELDANAEVVSNEDGSATITINPSKVFDDTIIHEFGHIYIDLLGGVENSQIRNGINQLRDSALWTEVAEKYPELTGDRLSKEVLVTAIGREGSKIFTDNEKQNRFERWLARLFERIGRLFGVQPNVARDLAREIIDSKLQRDLTGTISKDIQRQKGSPVKADIIRGTKLDEFLTNRIVNLEKQLVKFSDETDFTKRLKEAKDLLSSLEQAQISKGINQIRKLIELNVDQMDKRLDSVESTDFDALSDEDAAKRESANFSSLYHTLVITNSFRDIADLDPSEFNPKSSDTVEQVKARAKLKKDVGSIKKVAIALSNVKARTIRLSMDLYRRKLKPISSNPEIINDTIDIFAAQLDESGGQRWLDALADSNNSFVALIVKDLNIHLDKRNNEFRALDIDWKKQLAGFKQSGWELNDIFEFDGAKKNGRLVTEYDIGKWDQSKQSMFAKAKALRIREESMPKDSKAREAVNIERRNLVRQWFAANQKDRPDITEFLDKKSKELGGKEGLAYKAWLRKNQYEDRNGELRNAGELTIPTPRWKSQKWTQIHNDSTPRGEVRKEFLAYTTRFLRDLVAHTDSTLIENGFIPAVPSDTRSYWQAVADTLTIENKAQSNNAIVDDADNLIHFIPFPFIRMLNQIQTEKINPDVDTTEEQIRKVKANDDIRKRNRQLHADELNFDLEKTMPLFMQSTLNHKYKKDIEHQMLLSKEILAHSQVIKGKGFGQWFNDTIRGRITGNPDTPLKVSAKGSNVEKHLNDFVKMVYYQDFESEEAEWFKKSGRLLLNFASLRGIGFNVFSGINNKSFGTIQNAMEAAGGTIYDRKSYAKARSLYNSNMIAFYGDRNKTSSTNLISALVKRFDILISQNELAGMPSGQEFTALHRFKWFTSTAYLMQHAGEHSMQNVVLLAMLESHRIDADGNIVDKGSFVDRVGDTGKIKTKSDSILGRLGFKGSIKFGVTDVRKIEIAKEEARKEFNKLPKLIDIFEFKDGIEVVKEEFKKVDDVKLSLFRQKAIAMNQYLHGIYNKEDAGAIQKYVIGRMAIQFRKWMIPGWNKRWGSKFGTSFWNERRGFPDEGMYITTYQFMKDMMVDYNNMFTNYKLHWHSMSEFQKANVRRTTTEFVFLVTTLLVGYLAKSLAGDDEEVKDNILFNMFMYQQDRLITELRTHYPLYGWINESSKMLQSPFAVWDTVRDALVLGNNMMMYPFRTEDERTYRSGIRYGQDKVMDQIIRLLPGTRQIERFGTLDDVNTFYKLY